MFEFQKLEVYKKQNHFI